MDARSLQFTYTERKNVSADAATFWDGVATSRLSALPAFQTEPSVALKLLSEEENAMERALHAFRAHHNALIPIHRFPAEIIAHIFSFLVQLAEDVSFVSIGHGERVDREATRSSSWVHVAHVCRRWRTIALQSTALWRHVNLDLGGSWAMEFIQRANNHPLSFRARRKLTRHAENIAVKYSDRASALHFSSPQGGFTRFFRRLAEGPPLPLLTSITIDIKGITMGDEDQHHSSLLPGLQAPNLRHLVLCSPLPARWSSMSRFTNLRTLDVRLQHFTPPIWPILTLTNLLDCLQNMLVLQTLSITDDLPSPKNVTLPTRTVRLLRIAHLALTGSVERVGYLLSHFHLPESAQIHLCLEVSDSPPDLSRIYGALEKNTPFAPAMAAIQQRGPSTPPRTIVQFLFGPAQQGSPMLQRPQTTIITVTSRIADHDLTLKMGRALVLAFMRRFASPSLVDLVLDSGELWTDQCWECVRDGATRLRRLLTDEHAAWTFSIPLLLDRMHEAGDDLDAAPASLAYPALTCWTLLGVQLNSTFPLEIGGEVRVLNLREVLIAVLGKRCRRGKWIKVVCFESCVAPEDWADGLQATVGKGVSVVIRGSSTDSVGPVPSNAQDNLLAVPL
ncbi:hypothetical protein FA95DRAFT_1539496 [Auriscalpium vulgare]|uniref:Uncharacterized protein n=1 Tax=Auriscalpium vulgare TaxID=40419 RepID=A0ACB8RWV5_9AGAM|nr:hypothetical protein FA95DRAFT_1539496 [Auriscalpium vulgare]